MNQALPNRDPLEQLVEEFACRCRDGQNPSIEEYAGRYPQWAEDIRVLFPAVLMMEQCKPRRESLPAADPRPKGPRGPGWMPEQLGEYQLLREIARGGMGIVYEALQGSLNRRVALKVLPAHLFGNETLRSRFHREAKAAARLHHTNIVPVFGVGEQDGLCFFAMQLIAGASLDTLVGSNEQRDRESAGQPAPPGPGDPLSTKGVARIGVQVADALAYAHSLGVLHRDIKPSNLLLDAQGTVWVTDFGVAKLIEEANLTQAGDLVGTLRYMPPERFLGQSDTRGDVYSLGLTLYELLTRRPAFQDPTPQHLIELITHTDLPALRTLVPGIPVDLETIIHKSIARDPAHRYPSAAELADDLRRFLDDRPILARRASKARLFWRWCSRNRLVAGLAAAALGLLVLTSVVSVAAWLRTSAANREKDAANEGLQLSLAAEQSQRERAEKTSAAALKALNRIQDKLAPNRIVVAPRAGPTVSDEDGREPPRPLLSPETVRLLEELLVFYEDLAREGSAVATLQAESAEANQRIGDLRLRLGQYDAAVAAYQKAIELYPESSAPEKETVRIKKARTWNDLGRAFRILQRPEEASNAHAQALATLAAPPAELASRPEYRYELARTWYFQSRREPRTGRPGPVQDQGQAPPRHPSAGQEKTGEQAVALLEGLVKDHPAVPEYCHLLACCYRDGPAGRSSPGAQPGGPNTARAIKLLRQLVEDFPTVPDYRYDLCETLARAGFSGQRIEPGEAEPHIRMLEEAITRARGLAAEYPSFPVYAAAHARNHERLGSLLHQLKRLEEAERAFRKAVELQTDLVQQQPGVVAVQLALAANQSSLARVLAERGARQEARTILEAIAQRLEEVAAKTPLSSRTRSALARRYRELAALLEQQGEADLASQALRKAEKFGSAGQSGGVPRPGR
jgi:serine/threonine protein kinase/tetratricopeptide (TPR) repeat protein